MPLLNSYNLPQSPVTHAAETVRLWLASAPGIYSKLNLSVLMGVDQMLKDAIDSKMQETQMPCARMVYSSSDYEVSGNSGAAIFVDVPISVFFFYSTGINTSILPVEFTDLRDRHIRWNIEWLKNLRVLPNNAVGMPDTAFVDDNGQRYWWWPNGEQKFHVTHDPTFEIAGVPFKAPPGFAISQLDFAIQVKNHATFNGDPDPDLFKDAMTLFVPNETPVGDIDGANIAFTLSKVPKVASNGNSSLMLFLNNAIILDYTIIGATITLNTAPQVDDTLTAYYYS